MAWAQHVEATGDKSVAWHLRRMDGWGGSEIGTLVGEGLGIYDPFTTAREGVRRKLMIDPPEATTELMRRGTLLEPVIAQMFCSDYGATPLPEVQAAIEAAIDPAHPWKNVSLDGVVEIGGRRYIVDYKAPSEVPAGTPFGYHCQLNQYDDMATIAGERIDGLLLACFDYQHGHVVVLEVEQDANVKALINQAGDQYWGMVLAGEVPGFPERPEREPLALSEAATDRLHTIESKFLAETLLAKTHADNAKSLRADALSLLQSTGQRLMGSDSPFQHLKLQVSEKLRTDEIAELMRRHGQDPAELMVPKPGSYDVDAMLGALVELGQDPAMFEKSVMDADKAHAAITDLGGDRSFFVDETVTLKLPTARSKAGQALEPMKDGAVSAAQTAAEALQNLPPQPTEAPAPEPV